MKRATTLFVLGAFAAVAWSARPAEAQVERGVFDVNVGGGVMLHQNKSALVTASPLINMKARAFINETVGVGFSLDYSRTETDDDVFPLAQFEFPTADSALFVALKQPVAVFHSELIGTLGTALSGGSIYPYLTGGIGGYTLYVDPQQNSGPTRQSDLLLSIGAAVKFRLSGSGALEIGVRDAIYTGFERDQLNPTPDRTCRVSGVNQFTGTVCPNERFPFLDPEAPEESSTLHNLIFSASFSFFPRL